MIQAYYPDDVSCVIRTTLFVLPHGQPDIDERHMASSSGGPPDTRPGMLPSDVLDPVSANGGHTFLVDLYLAGDILAEKLHNHRLWRLTMIAHAWELIRTFSPVRAHTWPNSLHGQHLRMNAFFSAVRLTGLAAGRPTGRPHARGPSDLSCCVDRFLAAVSGKLV